MMAGVESQSVRASGVEAAMKAGRIAAVSRYKVILVDDYPEILQRVEKLLAPKFDVLEKCPTAKAALDAVDRWDPDVVVLDISMPPGLSGIELSRAIRQKTSKPRFVYLTQHEDEGLAHAVREEGGYAYVVKRLVATDLVPAIQAVMEGKTFVSEFAP